MSTPTKTIPVSHKASMDREKKINGAPAANRHFSRCCSQGLPCRCCTVVNTFSSPNPRHVAGISHMERLNATTNTENQKELCARPFAYLMPRPNARKFLVTARHSLESVGDRGPMMIGLDTFDIMRSKTVKKTRRQTLKSVAIPPARFLMLKVC